MAHKVPPSMATRAAKARDQYTCQSCGKTSKDFWGFSRAIHAHHIIPLSLGGANDLDNIVTLCQTCHGMAHSRSGLPVLMEIARTRNLARFDEEVVGW